MNKFALCITGIRIRGIFDISSKLNKNKGFEWRPIQKSSLLSCLGKNMKKCRSFIQHATKAELVNLNDLVTLFYDHVPLTSESNGAPSFIPHWTCLISPEDGEAFIQTPQFCSQFTHESLTGLLDILEELGCANVFAAVKKGSEDMMGMIRLFMGVGFQMVPPTVKHMEGYVFLGFNL